MGSSRSASDEMFILTGTLAQQEIVREALNLCDFPFERLKDGLKREDKTDIIVEWRDLSRYNEAVMVNRMHDGEHSHIEDGDAIAHPIERVVDGRRQVLGLFYLPPYTKVVLDSSMVTRPALAREVALAELAHAVDYHYMTSDHRRKITNILHEEDLPEDADVSDGAAFNLDGHTCSWFDVGPYRMWVGEAFMETFTEAFAPSVKVTIALQHPTGPEQARQVRDILVEPEPLPEEEAPYCGFTTRVFHKKTCWVVRLVPLRCNSVFWSVEHAWKSGRRGCLFCKP